MLDAPTSTHLLYHNILQLESMALRMTETDGSGNTVATYVGSTSADGSDTRIDVIVCTLNITLNLSDGNHTSTPQLTASFATAAREPQERVERLHRGLSADGVPPHSHRRLPRVRKPRAGRRVVVKLYGR